MTKIVPIKDFLLARRSLGIFPDSIITPKANDLLVRSLNNEYKVWLNNDNALIPTTNSLLKEASPGSIEFSIVSVSLGELLVKGEKYEDALKVLNINIEGRDGYTNSLIYKKWYLSALAYKNLGRLDLYKDSLRSGLNSLKRIPLDSEIESLNWLFKLFDEYHLSGEDTITHLETLFSNPNFVLSYTNYFPGVNRPQELIDFVNKRGEQLLSSTKFPNSDESNNYELEEFLDKVSATSYFKTTDMFERGIAKTYQSISILKSYCLILLKQHDVRLVKASFKVFIEYIESSYELNHKYTDIVGILNLFQQVFDNRFNNDSDLSDEEFHHYSKLLEKFKELVSYFYETNDLKINAEDILTAPLNKTSLLRVTLSNIWNSLAVSNYEIFRSSNSILSKNIESIEKSLTYYENSIHLNQNNLIMFNYIKTLTLFGQYKKSFKLTKYLLKQLESGSLLYFRSWHLFSLLLSIEENKEESFKVISFLVNEVVDFVDNNENVPFIFKQAFIEIKITHLAIIEALYGAEQSLDSLPELFQLFNGLFKFEIIDEVKPVEKHRLSRTQTLTRVITKHKQKEVQITKSKSTLTNAEQQILQKVWLVASTIYTKLSLTSEAEQSIIEAENCYRQTSLTHSSLALLTIRSRPELALKEYENALIHDNLNLTAIIGFSNLILNNESIFIDEKDKLAGIARAKLLLESVVETFSGGFNSEVWWLLSKIYEMNGDKKRLNLSLWKCIKLEESRSVRDVTVV